MALFVIACTADASAAYGCCSHYTWMSSTIDVRAVAEILWVGLTYSSPAHGFVNQPANCLQAHRRIVPVPCMHATI